MKVLYLRKTNIINSNIRQEYLTSVDKQEHLLYSSSLDTTFNFKNINKELVIELPNEIMDIMKLEENLRYPITSYKELHDLYIQEFKNLTGYENVSGAIHLNKAKTNLHLHLSYVDRQLITVPQIAKRDSYIYSSTGIKLKKKDYNKNNPNHMLIKKGQPLLEFDTIDSLKKEEYKYNLTSSNISMKKKFQLHEDIKSQHIKVDVFEYSKCLESGLDFKEQRNKLDIYKKHYVNYNNKVLETFYYKKKYLTVKQYKELGLETQKKIGKIKTKENRIQKNNRIYNSAVKTYNKNFIKILNSKSINAEEKQKIISTEKKRKDEYTIPNKYTNMRLNNLYKKIVNLKVGTNHLNNIFNTIKKSLSKAYENTFDKKYSAKKKSPSQIKKRDKGISR